MNKTNDFKYNLPAYSDPVDIEDLNDNFRGIDDALMAGLCKKDYTGNNMGSSDPSARKYAWAPWLEIVNDNEFDVVVTDRNAPVGSEEATINIAAGQTFRKYINGRYYMNFYVQDQYDVTFKWFTNAETYINESGGGGGGTGTVTSVSVQGGSGSHLTGSGNPIETSGIITINVDEGYSIPSDNEQTAWDGKAADLKFEINSSTFVITAQLKDSSGNLIGNERTIDLPLETMVVDGEYDPQTQKIKLELKNGNYVEFSVADLVSGLQTELSASNKLDPAYIDYDSSHRAVSDTEKDTWSGKQNAISDLETIRSGATAGATAVQPSAMQTALAGKQDSLDQTQLAAVNSGIDSSKVGQISTNQTNILYALNRTGKNYYNIKNDTSSFVDKNTITIASGTKSVTFVANEDGSITISGASEGTAPTVVLEIGDLSKYAGMYLSGAYSDKIFLQIEQSTSPYDLYGKDTGEGGQITASIPQKATFFIRVISNYTITNPITLYPMISETAMHDKDPSYQPYTLPNYDLTYLQAEDRASLAEVVDSGAKNLLDTSTTTISNVTFTQDSNSYITASPNNADTRSWNYANTQYKLNLKAGTYIFAMDIKTATSNTGIGFNLYSSNGTSVIHSETSEILNKTGMITWQFTITTEGTYGVIYKCFDMVARLMICTKAAFGVSQKFVPYRPNYDTLVSSTPTLKRAAYWSSSFTIPVLPFDTSSGGYMYKVYVNGGNPGELGVYLITGSLVTELKTHSKVSYTINIGTSVVFNATSTVIAYYELIKFPN